MKLHRVLPVHLQTQMLGTLDIRADDRQVEHVDGASRGDRDDEHGHGDSIQADATGLHHNQLAVSSEHRDGDESGEED